MPVNNCVTTPMDPIAVSVWTATGSIVMDFHAQVHKRKSKFIPCMCAVVDSQCNAYTDIDECAEGISGCDQTCTNLAGSYSCSCGSGYRLASNRHGCSDINECATGMDDCAHSCTNTIGSYTCSCDSGYRLASDGQMCNGELLIL